MTHSDVNIPFIPWSPRFEALGDFTEAPQQHLSGPVVQIVNIGSVRFGPLSKITQ